MNTLPALNKIPKPSIIITMSIDGYRISKSRDEILKLVQKKFEAENVFTIWQKDPNTETRIFKCDVKFSSINTFDGIFSVAIDEKHKANFNSGLETYFLLQIQDFVFKTKSSIVQTSQRGSLTFQIPHDVRLKELRICPRVYFTPEDKRFLSVKFESKSDEENKIKVACPIYNISKSGVCIIISKETLSSIKLNESIALEGLSFFESLKNEMKAVVKNARLHTKKGVSSDEYYALGLEFQSV